MVARMEKRYLPPEALIGKEEDHGHRDQRVIKVKVEPLTAEAYAPYGALVDVGRLQLHCSDGQYTARLMALEPASPRITRVNRHFDHTQLFVPLTGEPMLLVVAPPHVSGEEFDPEQVRGVPQRRHAGVHLQRRHLAHRAARARRDGREGDQRPGLALHGAHRADRLRGADRGGRPAGDVKRLAPGRRNSLDCIEQFDGV